MAVRSLFSIASWVLVAGAVLLQFLVILSGAVSGSPENQIYFLQAATNGIPGAPNPSRWTYFALCGVDGNGHNANCRGVHPAFPFDPPNSRNFGTSKGVPGSLLNTSEYFLLSRFAWAFYLIALLFAVIALFTGVLALCARLGAYITALNTALAMIFQALASALITVWVIKGRDAFNGHGQSAKIGVKAMAFTWSSFACLFLSTVLYCLAGSLGRSKNSSSYDNGRSGGGLFNRNRQSVRSTRSHKSAVSRGSFVGSDRNNTGTRGVKDDYS